MIFLFIILGFVGAIGALVRFGLAKSYSPSRERQTPVSSPTSDPTSYFERYMPPKTSGQGEAL